MDPGSAIVEYLISAAPIGLTVSFWGWWQAIKDKADMASAHRESLRHLADLLKDEREMRFREVEAARKEVREAYEYAEAARRHQTETEKEIRALTIQLLTRSQRSSDISDGTSHPQRGERES